MANLIKHIAMRVISIEESKQFYETVFGYKHVNTVLRKGKHGDHISCHMTDGYMDLTLIHYESEDADEANFAGPAPCIHHIGMEVEDLDAFIKGVKDNGGEILTENGCFAVSFFASISSTLGAFFIALAMAILVAS